MLNSFPFLKQRDSMHCGITCLQMICRYFGKDHISIYLRKRSFCTNEGISLFAITQIANEIGLKSLSLKTSIGALENHSRDHGLPYVALNHLSTLYRKTTSVVSRV